MQAKAEPSRGSRGAELFHQSAFGAVDEIKNNLKLRNDLQFAFDPQIFPQVMKKSYARNLPHLVIY